MKRLGILALLAGLIITVGLVENVYAVSEAGAHILLVEPGAKANAVGKAYTSIADDATSCWWNPAGLTFLQGNQISFMHSQLVPSLADDIFYEYLAYTTYFEGWGFLGFSVSYLTYGEQEGTTPSGETTDTWTSYEIVPGISYAMPLTDNSSVGFNFKLVWSDLAPARVTPDKKDGSGYAFGFDIGYLHKNLFIENLSVGANIANIGPNIKYIDEEQSDPLPRNVRISAAYDFEIMEDLFYSTVSAEAEKSLVFWDESDKLFSGENFIGKAGFEVSYINTIAGRLGYVWDDDGDIKGISWGAGIRYIGFAFDFAVIPQATGLDEVKRFSLGYTF